MIRSSMFVGFLLCNWFATPPGIPELANDEGVKLREEVTVSRANRVNLVLKARGSRPGVNAPGQNKPAVLPEERSRTEVTTGDFPFVFDSNLHWNERVQLVGTDGGPKRVLRRVEQAEGTIDFFRGPGQLVSTRLRPSLGLLIAERRGELCVITSAGGPLTRSELDLVHVVGDPLLLIDLLPKVEVSIGSTWDLPPAVAKGLSEYETLQSSTLRGKLLALGESQARIELAGDVKGSVRGSEGSIALTGEAVFDRKAALLTHVKIDRLEVRQSGPVESALNVKSTILLERSPVAIPGELSDEALKELPLDPDPRRELLLLDPPDGSYTLLHDRQWHIVQDDIRRVVLKRMNEGRLICQCDLVMGPRAGRGRHQELGQFRDDIRKAVGNLFGAFAGSGEVGGATAGGLRYKVAVEGMEQEGGVVPLWYYYLVASSEGEQLIGVFTLSRAVEPKFGDQDLRMMGTLEWRSRVNPRD